MRTNLTRCLVLLTLLVLLPSNARTDDAPPPPPELKVLDRYVGVWNATFRAKPATWTPQETNGSAVDEFRWVLGNRFLELNATSKPEGMQAKILYTFDAGTKAYRSVYFNSKGQMTRYAGTWDEATKTFRWVGEVEGVPNQAKVVITDRWVDDDRREYTVVAKEAAGTVLFDMAGTAVRKK